MISSIFWSKYDELNGSEEHAGKKGREMLGVREIGGSTASGK